MLILKCTKEKNIPHQSTLGFTIRWQFLISSEIKEGGVFSWKTMNSIKWSWVSFDMEGFISTFWENAESEV